MANPKETSFREIIGVPVLYDRLKPEDYGKRGVEYDFYCTMRLKKKLNEAFRQVRAKFGYIRAILSAGAYVDKPGMHGEGRAFDLDAILWDYEKTPKTSPIHQTGDFIVRDSPKYWNLMLGIEACFRKKFGVVLTPFYNRAHADHFHIDDSAPVRFLVDSRSNILFVQAVSRYIIGLDIAIDGVYGPETEKALRIMAKKYWSVDDIKVLHDNWTGTLTYIIGDAYNSLKYNGEVQDEQKEETPLELLHNIYDEISILEKQGVDISGAMRALNEFSNNSETQSWLALFR